MAPTFISLVDFTPAAEQALTYTAHLAQPLHGHLLLLHVYQDAVLEPELAILAGPVPAAARQPLMERLTQRATRLPVPAEAELSVDSLATTVADLVRRRHPLLLALGRAHDEDFLDRLIGHQALPILQAAHHPLLLVPEGWTDPARPSRVLVAADENPFWLTSASLGLADLFDSLHATTTVVHVAPATGPSQAGMALESVHRTALFEGIADDSLHEIREESRANGILHAAAELDSQLLVVMARPHTFLGGLFHHSITAQLLRRSPIPVLVLPTMD